MGLASANQSALLISVFIYDISSRIQTRISRVEGENSDQLTTTTRKILQFYRCKRCYRFLLLFLPFKCTLSFYNLNPVLGNEGCIYTRGYQDLLYNWSGILAYLDKLQTGPSVTPIVSKQIYRFVIQRVCHGIESVDLYGLNNTLNL